MRLGPGFRNAKAASAYRGGEDGSWGLWPLSQHGMICSLKVKLAWKKKEREITRQKIFNLKLPSRKKCHPENDFIRFEMQM